jgi:hypothetical protein
MSVMYCMVERRNDIDCIWETVAGLICIDTDEAQILIDRYLENQFDICEYRQRMCTKVEYEGTPCPMRLISPGVTGDEE